MAILFSVALVKLWTFQRDQIVARHAEVVRTVALAIGRDIETTVLHLQHMATSPLIAPGSIDVFDERCREVLALRHDWEAMALYEPSGKELISTRLPPGATLASLPLHGHVADVFASGEARVSSAYIARQIDQWRIDVAVPVKREGKTAYVLTVSLSPEAFDDLLRARIAQSGGAAALFDSNLRFIARDVNASAVRGELAMQPFRMRMQETRAGQGEFRTIEGTAVLSVWEPINSAGWIVAIGIPTGAAYAALWPVLLMLVICACAALSGAVLLTLRTSRRVAGAIEGAAAQAAALAQGKHVAVTRTGIVELDELGEALAKSSDRIAAGERERARLLENERRARSEAERTNQAKDELLAMLGHELRNPLASIGTSVHLLHEPRSSPETLRYAYEVIARQTSILVRLVEDLLDVARFVTGKIHLARAPMDLRVVVDSVVSNLNAAGHARNHALTVDSVPTFVDGDFTRLHQVVTNLLSNALRYTPAGGAIRVELRPQAGQAVLSVRDTGAGLSAEEMARVFDVFHQGGKSARHGGLGLGLTLVRRIVEGHGGTVAVESPGHGKGATFIVRLAAIEPHSVLAATPSVSERDAQIRACAVLLIEDNEDLVHTLRHALELEGHQVTAATDGLSGLRAALTVRPQVAIVDINLPGIDGYSVARQIRKEVQQSIYLVALTGYGQVQDVLHAGQAGFDIHMAKPPDMRRLLALLHDACNKPDHESSAVHG